MGDSEYWEMDTGEWDDLLEAHAWYSGATSTEETKTGQTAIDKMADR